MVVWGRWWRIAWQVALLSGISFVGNWLTAYFGWPVPGNVVGLLLLLLSLAGGVVRLQWVEQGSAWLLDDMLLFFIPAAVGIVEYGELMKKSGVRILLVIAFSTTLVMLSTAVLAERLAVWRGHQPKRRGNE